MTTFSCLQVYSHWFVSLVVGMAQDFVGSNNINLLTPSGQFGTRLMGGNDAASPRYIFTHLSPLARLIFPEADGELHNILLSHIVLIPYSHLISL